MPTELEIAQNIRDGLLPSPTRLGGMELWAIRITGTGASFRPKLKEYVWRPEEHYLTDEFLSRCNGLPVIWVHPQEKQKLDSDEFAQRVIGSVMLPYIQGRDVWAVARIYDDEAIQRMKGAQFSTSPGVVFTSKDGNVSHKLNDDYHLLVEGKPSLLDHIAIVTNGVWDRGGDPAGVLTSALNPITKGMTMTDEEKAAAAREDAAKLDKVLAHLDSLGKRMDSYESARKDSEEAEAKKAEHEKEEKARADKARRDSARKDRFHARKDSESDEDFKKRFDADEEAERHDSEEEGCEPSVAMDRAKRARKDAETAEEKRALEKANKVREEEKSRHDSALAIENENLKARLANVEAFMKEQTREIPARERDLLASCQSRADAVAALFGDRATAPLPGETSLAYRKRQLDKFKHHSERFKASRFDSLDEAMIEPIEAIVYNDAAEAARIPAKTSAGALFAIESRDSAGRLITTFEGDPMSWMQHFVGQGAVGSFAKGN